MNEWLRAATTLADTLDAENTALEALDMTTATGLLERKRAARAALEGAPRAAAPVLRTVAARLADSTARNKQLLERAIAVQGQVIARLVRAVPAALPAARYGAGGRQVYRATPIAMRARV